MNILTLLKKDHAEVKGFLAKLEKTTAKSAPKRKVILKKIRDALAMHELIEETVFYPVLKEYKAVRELIMEAYQEHHFANAIFAEVEKTDASHEMWKAKFMVFQENLKHHIKEEESKLFPKVKKLLKKAELEIMGEKALLMKRKAGKHPKHARVRTPVPQKKKRSSYAR